MSIRPVLTWFLHQNINYTLRILFLGPRLRIKYEEYMTGERSMTNRLLISTLQDLCWALEPIGQQLPQLIQATHPYQPLLSLLERNIVEICILLENNKSNLDFTVLTMRIAELTRLIVLMRDYVFDSMDDEKVDSYLTQIKEGLEHIVWLMTPVLSMEKEVILA